MTDLELLHIITMPTRYQILMLLLNHHYCGKALSAKLGISESAVSQHLQVLKNCGLVTGLRIDYQMHYQVNKDLMLRAVNALCQALSETEKTHWDQENCDCEFDASCSRRGDSRKS